MEKAHRLSVIEAGEILEMSPSMVRAGMRQGTLPIGSVIKDSSKYTFYIYEEKLEQYLHSRTEHIEVGVLNQIIDYVTRLKEEIENA